MRLIDADALKKQYTQIFIEAFGVKGAEMFRGAINQQPTAYDVDKVVEELEENQSEAHMYTGSYEDYDEYYQGEFDAYTHAIRIVKRGGVDD